MRFGETEVESCCVATAATADLRLGDLDIWGVWVNLVFIITYIICAPRRAGEACVIIQPEAYPAGPRRFRFSPEKQQA